MPEFSSIKSDERRRNKPGGVIYFDQDEERLLDEVEVSAVKPSFAEQKPARSEKDTFLEADVKAEIKILGVVFNTYILTEYGDSIYIIDQHAMHERQLYEKIKKEVEDKSVIKQDLLVPYEFGLTPLDAEKFERSLKNLNEIGFEVTFDGHIFTIKSVPYVLSNINLNNFVEEVLGDETIGDKKASTFINEKLCQHACKHAIRAGDVVTKDEIAYLIEEMKKSVLLCPHGRPIVVKLTRKELEKMFKRVL